MTQAPATEPTRALTPIAGRPPRSEPAGATAVIYCEANFGASDGKTANGLVRHSEKYEILSVIDSEKGRPGRR